MNSRRDRFYITGYPRSRTGWLANLMCYGTCLCLHDGLAAGKSCLDQIDRVAGDGILHIGNSDSGYLLDQPPSGKVVLIERDRAEAEQSFLDYFSRFPYPECGQPDKGRTKSAFDLMQSNLFILQQADGVLRVGFDALDSVDVVEKIWDFIVPDQRFNPTRWKILDRLKVNPMSEKVRTLWD